MYAVNMTVNSSSTCSSASFFFCANTDAFFPLYTAFAALRFILIIPLSTFILYLGHQRWRQHRSSKPATHSDIFTYHVAAMELIWVLGTLCLYCGVYTNHSVMITTGNIFSSITFHGQTFFLLLTCVERYLAVVHPITYMGLRNARGVKIRNICVACVWLMCFGLMCLTVVTFPDHISIQIISILVPSIIVMSFCSLSVLCVLIRPGPGEGREQKERLDQSKLRVFYTITALSAAVWLWFFGYLVSTAVKLSHVNVSRVVHGIVGFLNLPSSLVSPLLYLHREGKLKSCCCKDNE